MALENCKAEIGKVIGRDLTKREEGIIARTAKALKDRIERANNDPTAISGVLQEYADTAAAIANVQKRQLALNYLARERIIGWANRVMPSVKDGAEVLKALVRGSLFNFEGAKDSAATLARREANTRQFRLIADLYKAKVQDFAFNPANDQAIGRAQFDLRSGVDPAEVSRKYGQLAADTAKILEQHRETLRLDLNKAGAWVGKNADAIFRRSHDAVKIARAGGNDFGSDAAKAAWVDDVYRKMDWTKAFDGEMATETEAERRKLLGDLWGQFAADSHLKESSGFGVGPGSKGRKWSHARQLAFKSADDEVDYLKKFGRGGSIAETVLQEMETAGKDLALMQKLGPNAEAQFHELYNHLKTKLAQEGASPQARKRLDDTYAELKDNDWRILNGMAGHPAGNYSASWLQAGRMWTNAAMIANSIWAITGDTAIRASMVAQRSGTSVAAGMFENYMKQAMGTGLSREAAIDLAAEMGVRFEGLTTPIDLHTGELVPGIAAKAMKWTLRLGLHNGWVNRERVNSLTADSLHYWQLRNQKFNGLRASEQGILQQFGINEKEWEILRNTDAVDLGEGRKGLTPDNILKTDLQKFRSLVGDPQPSEAQLMRARLELANQYRNLLGEIADRATVSPSYALQAFSKFGYSAFQPGTVQGELYRSALQLKGFMMNYMRNHLGRELYGYSSEYRSFSQAMSDMLKGKNPNAAKGMAKLIVAGTLNFYVVNALKDIASGKSPLNPFDWDAAKHGSYWDTPGFAAFTKAMAKQSLGLYGEVLLADTGRGEGTIEKIMSHFVGPEAELGGDVADNFLRYAKLMGKNGGPSSKELGKANQQLFGTAWRNTPGTSLFWTKAATDNYIYNEFADALNPGYKKRVQDKLKKQGQVNLLP